MPTVLISRCMEARMSEKVTLSKQNRIPGIDFIRIVCAIGIIIHHYSCHSVGSYKPLTVYANGNAGFIVVQVFFMVSGLVLYHNYPKVERPGVFYYKRFISMFPAFYLAFAAFYMDNVFRTGKVFYLGHPLKLLETLIGMDGYLYYRDPGNYYILGEWFLGAIIILYLLYPMLAWLIDKSMPVAVILVAGLYLFFLSTDFWVIAHERNMISCLLAFFIGIVFGKYKALFLEKRYVWLGALVVAVVVANVPLPGKENLWMHVMSASSFLVLQRIGSFVERITVKGKSVGASVCAELGGLGYCIFLLQHQLIVRMQAVYNPVKPLGIWLWMLVTTIVVVIYAKCLSVVTNALTTSRPVKWLEGRMIRKG